MKWSEMTAKQKDALVAEKVFNREIIPFEHLGTTRLLMRRENQPGLVEEIPNYSTSMDAAWQIVEKLYNQGLRVALSTREGVGGKYRVNIFAMPSDKLVAISHSNDNISDPLCLAALKACGVNIEP